MLNLHSYSKYLSHEDIDAGHCNAQCPSCKSMNAYSVYEDEEIGCRDCERVFYVRQWQSDNDRIEAEMCAYYDALEASWDEVGYA